MEFKLDTLPTGRGRVAPGEGSARQLVDLRPYLDDDCHYVVMDLSPDCTEAEVKDAYRKRAVLYHPDSTRLPPAEAVPKFIRLQEAYAQLSDPATRRWYDYRLTIDTLARAEQLGPRAPRLDTASSSASESTSTSASSSASRREESSSGPQAGSPRYLWPYESGARTSGPPEWSEEYRVANRERAGYLNKGTDELGNGEMVPLSEFATIGLGADLIAIGVALALALGIVASGNLDNVSADPSSDPLFALLASSPSGGR